MVVKEVEPDTNNGRMERSAFRVRGCLQPAHTHPHASSLAHRALQPCCLLHIPRLFQDPSFQASVQASAPCEEVNLRWAPATLMAMNHRYPSAGLGTILPLRKQTQALTCKAR